MNPLSLFSSKFIGWDLLVLFGLALLTRLLAALPQQQPNYMDAAYSYVNALNLVSGQGFVEKFVWNYLNNPGPPPQPSHLYWMPLTTMLAWLGMFVGGANYRAAQVPFIVISALLGPISYWLTFSVSSRRGLSWLAGLFAIFSGFYFPFWTAIDNFTPFAVSGSLALIMAWRGMVSKPILGSNGRAIYLILAGASVGLAHLARADGLLLLIAILLILIFHARPKTQEVSHHLPYGFTFHVLRITFFVALGYALAMTPWFVRNWQAVGTLLPTAGTQTIWLATANDLFSSYSNLFSYGRELSARTFFAQGAGPIILGRWWVLSANLQTVLVVWGMIFLAPLVAVGGWHLRRHLLFQLAGLYALLLFLTMSLVFAFPGALGGLFHSGAALLPFIDATAAIGLNTAVDWAGARRRHWDVRLAKQVFGVGLVVIAIALSSFIYYSRVLKNNTWNNADNLYGSIATWVAKQNPTAIVMINNPPAYQYHGGGLSVVVPNENLETTLQVARQYQVDYLVLGPNRPAPLAGVYDRTVTHPELSLVNSFGNIHIFEIVRR